MDWRSIVNGYNVPHVQWLGMQFLTAAPERVTAEMPVRDELCNGAGRVSPT